MRAIHGSVYVRRVDRKRKQAAYRWDAGAVRGLRRHLELTQAQLADELGVRQQTVSEWETGLYRPRGASERLLGIVADRGGYRYGASQGDRPRPTAGD